MYGVTLCDLHPSSDATAKVNKIRTIMLTDLELEKRFSHLLPDFELYRAKFWISKFLDPRSRS